jgi:hypothetical protein
MKWSKAEQMLFGPADGELLNKLASLVTLPKNIEAERQRLNQIADAVDRERMTEEPVPLYEYPVKYPLFKHQTRGANMALITFGLVEPPPAPEQVTNNPDDGKEDADDSINHFLKMVNGEGEENE